MAAPPDSPVVLLIPGMTLNASIFPALPYRTVTADFTRYVPSENGAPPPGADAMGQYVTALDRMLAEDAAWANSPRIVVGHSFGGMLAMAWYLHHGGTGLGRIEGLVLVATTAGPMFGAVSMRVARMGRLEWRVPIERVMRLWNRPRVTRLVKRLMTGGTLDVRPVDFQSLRTPTDLTVDFAGWRNTDWRAMRSFRLALDGFDVTRRLPAVSVPTIVLHGSEDSLFPVSVARDLASGLPDAELRVIAGAPHAMPLTHGDALVQAVADVHERFRGAPPGRPSGR